MNKKYTIISRDEFIKLYKFGSLLLIESQIIDEDIEKIRNLEKLLKELPFDDEFGFLIIKFSFLKKDFKNLYSLDIKNLETIYCLSESAKEWYSIKFNSKIRFRVIEHLNIEQVKEFKELENIKKGSEVIFKMFENSLEKRDLIESELAEISLSKFLLNFYKTQNDFQFEYKNFYFDLITYQRENKFKKEDVSFFYDLIILVLLKERKDINLKLYKSGDFNLKKYRSYQLLEDNKQNNLYEYIKYIKNSKDKKIQAFISKFYSFEDLVIGAIFLKIRELLNEDDGRKSGYQNEIGRLVDDFKDEYRQELSIAFYLIGSLLGYSKLYDDFYDAEDLNIFKEEVNKEINEIDILRIENQELKKIQEEKNSKIVELKKAQEIAKKEKIEFEEKLKKELEKLRLEKDTEIKKLKEAKINLEKEKTVKEINKPIQNIDELLKDISVETLMKIAKELGSATKAKKVNGLNKAIKKVCTTNDKIEQLKKLVEIERKNENLFELAN